MAHSKTEWPSGRHNGAQFKKQLCTGHFVIQNITVGLISVLNKLTHDLGLDKIQNIWPIIKSTLGSETHGLKGFEI